MDNLTRFHNYSGSLLKFLQQANENGTYPYKFDKVQWYVNNQDFNEE